MSIGFIPLYNSIFIDAKMFDASLVGNLLMVEAAANFGADRTILPIPQREIDNNIGLQGQQNPSYNYSPAF